MSLEPDEPDEPASLSDRRRARLPDRDALRQLRAEGWTYEDIAAHYGVTKGDVYLRLKRDK